MSLQRSSYSTSCYIDYFFSFFFFLNLSSNLTLLHKFNNIIPIKKVVSWDTRFLFGIVIRSNLITFQISTSIFHLLVSKFRFYVIEIVYRFSLSLSLSKFVLDQSAHTESSVSDPMNLELLLSRSQCPASVASGSTRALVVYAESRRDRNWSYRLSTARNRMYWISKFHECSHRHSETGYTLERVQESIDGPI